MPHISSDVLTQVRLTLQAFAEQAPLPEGWLPELQAALHGLGAEALESDPPAMVSKQHFAGDYVADLRLSLTQRESWLAHRRLEIWLAMLAKEGGDEKKIAGDAKAREAKLDDACFLDVLYSEIESQRRTEIWQIAQEEATIKAYDWLLKLALK